MPAWIVRKLKGRGNYLAVWTVLALRADRQDGRCFPTISTIMEDSGLSIDTVRAALKFMQAEGMLEVRQKFGATGQQKANDFFLKFSEPQGGVGNSHPSEKTLPSENSAPSEKSGGSEDSAGRGTEISTPSTISRELDPEPTPYSPPSKPEKPKKKPKAEPSESAMRLIGLINELSGRKYDPRAQAKFAEARLNARPPDPGGTEADLELVVRYLACRWLPDDKMRQHFIAETIFRPSKWDQRITDARAWDEAGRPTGESESPGHHFDSTRLENLRAAKDLAELSNDHPIWNAFELWLIASMVRPPEILRDGTHQGLLNIGGMARQWAEELAFSPEVILKAAKAIKDSSKFWPTFSDFREACKTAKAGIASAAIKVAEDDLSMALVKEVGNRGEETALQRELRLRRESQKEKSIVSSGA